MMRIRNIRNPRAAGIRRANGSRAVMDTAPRGNAGFTLVETMLALLILVLLTGVVASGIPVATRTYEKTVDAANAEVALTTTAAKLRDELGLAQDVYIPTAAGSTGERVVAYYKRSDGYWAKIVNPTGDEKGLYVQAYAGMPDGTAGGGLTAYKKIPLIPDSTMVGNLKVQIGGDDSITYNADTGVFTVNGLKVTMDGNDYATTGDGGNLPLKIRAALY